MVAAFVYLFRLSVPHLNLVRQTELSLLKDNTSCQSGGNSTHDDDDNNNNSVAASSGMMLNSHTTNEIRIERHETSEMLTRGWTGMNGVGVDG